MNRTETCWSIDLSLSFRVCYRYQRLIQLKTNKRLCAFVLLHLAFYHWTGKDQSAGAFVPFQNRVQPFAHNSLIMRVHCARIKFRRPITKLATTSDVKYNMITECRVLKSATAVIHSHCAPCTCAHAKPWQMKIIVILEVKINEWTKSRIYWAISWQERVKRSGYHGSYCVVSRNWHFKGWKYKPSWHFDASIGVRRCEYRSINRISEHLVRHDEASWNIRLRWSNCSTGVNCSSEVQNFTDNRALSSCWK